MPDTPAPDVLAAIEALDPDALSAWIRDRLHEADATVPDAPRQNVGQYYLVGAVYPSLRTGTQANVRRTLRRFLLQMDRGDGWDGRPGDALLLLVMQIGDPELAGPIRQMAERERFLAGDAPDEARHARLVQALAALRDKVTPNFWERQADRDPERYLALAVAGLRLHSLYQALGLLCRVPNPDDDMRVRLYPVLRGLLDRPDTTLDDLRTAVTDLEVGEALSPSMRAFVRETLSEAWGNAGDGSEDFVSPTEAQTRRARAFFAVRGYEPEHASLQFRPAA